MVSQSGGMLCTMRRLLPVVLFLAGCDATTSVSIENRRAVDTTVFVAFGADSVVNGDTWDFCSGDELSCSFPLAGNTTKPLPTPNGAYLNATFSFGQPVGCNTTKAEFNINNPKWYDVLDVSLVDGYNDPIQISVTPTGDAKATQIGPPVGKEGNENVFGVFPYGCDICVERQNPPCGISKGKSGCKEGTQYDPKVPCQWQGPKKGGGGQITVSLLD